MFSLDVFLVDVSKKHTYILLAYKTYMNITQAISNEKKWGMGLGKPSREKSAVFFNIVQKAFDPPPLSFDHHAEFAVSAGSENLI